jgi:hypothetical protein
MPDTPSDHARDCTAQYKSYFDALIEVKFTPEQALAIICAHGWKPR